MQKCWDNALVAMERVLDRDLTSIEAYLDDRVYKEMRDQVLKQLVNPTTLKPTLFQNLLEHFTSSYAQLRGNFIKFIIDTRLNSQFASSPPLDQILHLIERTRLLMSVERREFSEIFFEIQASPDLNKILETVGNLLFERIEQAAKHLKPEESKEIAAFIHPLMNSILSENNQKDPFGLFLKLLTERFGFKPPITSMKIEIHESVDNPDDTQFNSTSTHDNTVYVQSHNIDVINV